MYSWCAEYALEVRMSPENIWFLHQYSACFAASHRCSSLNTLIEEKKRPVECTCLLPEPISPEETFFFSFFWSELHARFQAAKD
jgi:hypothetical protein